jgi:hypothetical protein
MWRFLRYSGQWLPFIQSLQYTYMNWLRAQQLFDKAAEAQ